MTAGRWKDRNKDKWTMLNRILLPLMEINCLEVSHICKTSVPLSSTSVVKGRNTETF